MYVVFKIYYLVFHKYIIIAVEITYHHIIRSGVTSGAGTGCNSGAPELTSRF